MADITITQKITIELDGKSPFEYVVMKQGDKGSRVLAVSLLQNKQPYEIPTGCTARIKYYKPDGNPVLNDCTLSGNEILVTYTEQMLAAAGVGKGEIVLLKGGKELKSATYYTKIVETVYKTDGFVSDKEFLSMGTIFNDMDQAAQAAAANAKIAKQAAERADEAIDNMQGYVNTYLAEHPAEIDPELLDPKKCAPADAVGQLKEDLGEIDNAVFDTTTATEELVNTNPIVEDGKTLYTSTYIAIQEQSNSSIATLTNVVVGETLYISSTVANTTTSWGFTFTDDRNKTIYHYYDESLSGLADKTNIEVTVPEGATKLYVSRLSSKGKPEVFRKKAVKRKTPKSILIDVLHGKKLVVFGDSMAYGHTIPGSVWTKLLA